MCTMAKEQPHRAPLPPLEAAPRPSTVRCRHRRQRPLHPQPADRRWLRRPSTLDRVDPAPSKADPIPGPPDLACRRHNGRHRATLRGREKEGGAPRHYHPCFGDGEGETRWRWRRQDPPESRLGAMRVLSELSCDYLERTGSL